MIDKNETAKRVKLLIDKLVKLNFFGRLEIRLENGNIVYVTQSRGMKPEELPTMVSSPTGYTEKDLWS